MGFVDLASLSSLFKGVEYYRENRVFLFTKESEHVYRGKAKGRSDQIYDVKIDLEHPRQSRCSCPHANGRRVVCKHQVALYLMAFPEEYEKYEKQLQSYEEDEELELQEEISDIIAYVASLSESDVRDELVRMLIREKEEELFE